MKKVYNYITIVKEGHDLKIGKNCGMSCNRRNIMDKAHKRPTEIIAAINFPNMLESTLDRVLVMARTNPHIIVSLYCGTWTRSYLEDVELALDRIEEIAKSISKRAECVKYLTEPVKWSY